MKVAYDWLKDYLGENAPAAAEIEQLLSLQAFEVEGVADVGGHTVIDVDVLPNRAADCLCHRGIAREIATLTSRPLAHDPFATRPDMPTTDELSITIADPAACRHFDLALITGVTVGPSPDWLQSRLRAIGQRPINNVVDATNYVMFSLGQPLHAYDAGKFKQAGKGWQVGVRFAAAGESITTLGGETYELNERMLIIENGADGTPAGIAGIKGGAYAEIDDRTTTIILEAGNFDPALTRKTSQQLRLQTDASKRFENGVSSEVLAYALHACATLITELAGGAVSGYAHAHPTVIENPAVAVSLAKINGLLGLSLSEAEVADILDRLGFTHQTEGTVFQVTAPFPRTDINIPEDVIEEVGRVYGYQHVQSVVPEAAASIAVNPRHYYSEQARQTLTAHGFSEVITSSFRGKDEIQLQNALAKDKSWLRSSLANNIAEALDQNATRADLFGRPDTRLFEIGTVFTKASGRVEEHVALAYGVRLRPSGYSGKEDSVLAEMTAALEAALGTTLAPVMNRGVAEINFTEVYQNLPRPERYEAVGSTPDIAYQPFSPYPHVARDIALWVPETTTAALVEQAINEAAGPLRVRTTLFDEFKKDGRTSYAFRVVFQSNEKTLTDGEVNAIMDTVYRAVVDRGWEVR